MCWVAVNRGLRLADKRSLPADREKWLKVRDEIYEEIMEKGSSEEREAFVQSYGDDTLDASNLIMPLVFFLSPSDPRILKTRARTQEPMWTPHSISSGTGKGLDEIPFGATMGRARVVEIRDQESIKAEELRPHGIRKDERILFKTHNSVRRWAADDLFDEDFVFISQEGARFLAGCGVQTVGVDYLSVKGFYEDGEETHQAPLGAGIWVIEGLDLSELELGEYELVCLPIKVRHSDGAPARAILKATR